MLFEAKTPANHGDPTFDVTPDGEFLMIGPGESDTPLTQINVVVNWFQEVGSRIGR